MVSECTGKDSAISNREEDTSELSIKYTIITSRLDKEVDHIATQTSQSPLPFIFPSPLLN